jgi:hypothetical protein
LSPSTWLDYWAIAKYDLGLSLDEFWDCTPGVFQALCKRRNIRIKYERYAHAITASAVYNVNRHSADDPVISAFDFIRDEQSAVKQEKLRQAKQYIKQAIGNLPMTTSREKLLETRLKVIEDLRASGHADAEQLFTECWPSLTPDDAEKAG